MKEHKQTFRGNALFEINDQTHFFFLEEFGRTSLPGLR